MEPLPEIPAIDNPFKNAKLVGDGIDPDAYHRQVEGVDRGHKEFVLSRSELMLFNSNPNRWINGYHPKDTEAKANGSLIDTFVLDPMRFPKKYVTTPETCTATKTCKAVKDGEYREGDQMPWNPQLAECKDWKADQESKGLTVISSAQIQDCVDAKGRLMGDPHLGPFIECSKKQVMIVADYVDKNTKLVVPCKFLIDLVPDKGHPRYKEDLGDLKTAADGSPAGWHKVVNKYNYQVQAAMNLHAYNAATGENRINFRHVVQENQFPFQPGRRLLSQYFVNMGGLIYVSALRTYTQCLATDKWPSWDDNPITSLEGWTVVEPELWMINKI